MTSERVLPPGSQRVVPQTTRQITPHVSQRHADVQPDSALSAATPQVLHEASQLLTHPTPAGADSLAASGHVVQRYRILDGRSLPSAHFGSSSLLPHSTGLPARLKASVEALSGRALGDVTVHYNSDQPARLQALAYTQGSEIHLAAGQERHLPHEAWHVVQQQQGRVRPTLQATGVAINDDSTLEREADVMGHQAQTLSAGRQPTRPLPELGWRASLSGAPMTAQRRPVIQRYTVLPANRVFDDPNTMPSPPPLPAALISAAGSFPSQVLQNGSFLDATHNQANLDTSVNTPALRVSDDYELAIEDSTLQNRQPKTFFASDAVLSNSAKGLKQSRFELIKGTATLQLWKDNGQQVTLSSVFPQEKAKPLANPLDLLAAQNCQAIAGQVTSSDTRAAESVLVPSYVTNPTGADTVMSEVNLQAAALVSRLMKVTKKDRMKEYRDVPDFSDNPLADQAKKDAITNQIAQEYVQALQQGGTTLTKHLQKLKLNQFAAPEVGEAFVIATQGAANAQGQVQDIQTGNLIQPQWRYHFGGVIAKSGNDSITLENYARGAETAYPHSSPSSDPRWYFQMYGMGHGQSFHEANVASGGYANALTLTLRDPAKIQAEQHEAEQQKARFRQKIKYAGITIAVGLLAIAVGTLVKWGLG